MDHHFYALISRMRYIDRWALMRNTTRENIQEHSYEVAVLAHALAVIGRDVFHKELDPDKTAAVALFHDAPEIITGDMPTPVKYDNPDIHGAYQQVERMAADRLLEMLPPELAEEYRPLLLDQDPEVHALVKAADRLSAYIKCVEELKAGNLDFKRAGEQILESLKANPLPALGYFMEHFLPSFELTLDELN